MRKLLSSALFAVIAFACAQGATYYVSTSGSDSNPGSSSQPFRTITYGYGKARAGDTLLVMPGTYTDYTSGWGIHLGTSGSASSPITIKSQTPGAATIDGQNATGRNVGFYIDGSYNILSGFEIKNCPRGGISIWSSNCQVLNCNIHDNSASGIYSDDYTSGGIYIGNLISHNGAPASNLDHGMYLCGKNEMVINNVMVANSACGLQIAGYVTVSNMKVYNNVMALNGTDGIILWQALSGIDIKNNILYKNGHWGIDSCAASGSGVNVDHNVSYANVYGDYNFTDQGSTYSYTLGTTVKSDPKMVNEAAYTGFDAHLQAGSPAIGAGLNLSSTFTTDMAGAARSTSGAWDLGVYVSAVATSQAPTISSIANQTITADSLAGPLAFQVSDAQTAAGNLTLTANSSNPTLVPVANIIFGGSGSNRTVTVTPAAAQTGTGTITLNVSDGTLSTNTSFTLTVNASPVNQAPTISSIANQTITADSSAGPLAFQVSDAQTAAGNLTLTANSSNPTLVPVSNIVFGGSGSNRTVTVTPAAAQTGTGTITLNVSDGTLSTNASFTLTVNAAPSAPPPSTPPVVSSSSPSFASTSGTLTAPFFVTNGMICQPAYTSLTGSGRAAYSFTVPAGDYVISALVNAPTTDANSLFVNIDAEPADPLMVWDVPVTTGTAACTVSWRGNGSASSSSPSGMTAQFAPKVFTLSAGTHQLIVRGREANCQLGTITIVPLATPYSTNFASTSGTLAAPFYVTNGMICQPAYTGLSTSGRAAYTFTVPSTADYAVSAMVNAPTADCNSLFVNIDAEPSDPLMVWDVPVTTGATNLPVLWRGNGTVSSTSPSGISAQFAPKLFNLTAGTHQLIVRGREANCQLGAITVASASVMDIPWQALDIGSVGFTGTSSVTPSGCSLSGSGSIGGAADAFRYVYQSLSGDGEIRAQVSSVQSGGASGCVGVMIRETLTAGSRFALMGLSGSGTFQWVTRSSTSGSSAVTAGSSGAAPNCWVRVVRTGSTLYGYSSPDGNNWTLVGSTTISMATNIQFGFAVASGSTSSATSATLGSLVVIP